MHCIEVENLHRVYRPTVGTLRRRKREVVAIEDLSFAVEQGELFGLVGPNGAGKTTTVKILTTLLTPTSGTARVLGHDVVQEAGAIRARIGFIFGGERGLYWRLSGIDNLRYFASLYHMDPQVTKERIPALLEQVGLQNRGQERVEGYSRGMKQRLHIARALLHDPEVLFLDEPTLGLDPVGARELREMIGTLQAAGKTILLTTHYMFEADLLCQRIVVINEGRIIAEGSPQTLKALVQDLSVIEIEVFGVSAEILERLRAQPYVETVSTEERNQRQALLIQSPLGSEVVSKLLTVLDGVQVGKVTVREPTLEDAYVRLVKGDEGD